MSAFTAEVVRWQNMPTMLAAVNEQAFGRRQKDKSDFQWFQSKIARVLLGDPDKNLGTMLKKRVKPGLDRRFGKSPQEVVNSPRAVTGGVIRALRRGGHAMGPFGRPSKAHRSATPAGR